MVEKYDGLCAYIINLLIGTLELLATGQSHNGSIPISCLQTQSPEIIVDLCFFIFNLLYKSISKSPSFNMLRNFVFLKSTVIFYIQGNQSASNPLTDACKSIFVIDKLVFFLGLYSENLFLDIKIANSSPTIILRDGVENKLESIIYFLFNALLGFHNSQGTSHIASFSISNLLSIKQILPYYRSFMSQFFEKFICAITEIEVNPFFDLIKSLIKANDILDSAGIQLVVKKTVERVLKEIKSYKPSADDDSDQMSIAMNHCLNIIVEISDKYLYNPQAERYHIDESSINNMIPSDVFEEQVMVLINYIKNPNKIPCAIELISITTNILRNSNGPTSSLTVVYGSIKKILKKFSINRKIFEFICELLNKSESLFMDAVQSHELITNITDSICSNEEEEEISLIYICLTFHQLILVSLLK